MKGSIGFLLYIKNKKDTFIIVEGKRDKDVLKELGLNNIYTIYEIKKLENLSLYFKEAIILTDNDNKGNSLYKYLKNLLESEGIIINDRDRRKFFKYFKVREVENLRKNIEKLKFYINYFENPEKILYF
ncbi:MAG: toprim domain-containing protein [Nanopusillaceae archaeon]|jgi:5S rRNA maturation endonuclease (ribonuclease M5)